MALNRYSTALLRPGRPHGPAGRCHVPAFACGLGKPGHDRGFRPADAAARLATEREVSSIPRANHDPSNSEHAPAPAPAAAAAAAPAPGNWIYPSEAMFFAAMRRKAWDPRAEDMRTIVPIHNAVNERAWAEIKAWEAGRGSEA